MNRIDWKVVNANLKCPICGEKAYIEAGSDGMEAGHTHRFSLTREHAIELTKKFGKPTYEELEAEIKRLRSLFE